MTDQSYKYLVSSEQDQLWGMTVNTVGKQKIPAEYESYPPIKGHPEDFYFNPQKGRILDSFQLIYITDGNGIIYYKRPDNKIRVKHGDIFMLEPHVWHSYLPDKKTGWTEYWIGLKGVNIENRFNNNFFNPDQIIYHVGLREDVVDLYEKALEIARKEKAAYQQYLAGIANYILGIMMYSDKNTLFQGNEAYSRINRAKLIIRENLSSDMTLEDIAAEVNMSYSWFRKLFKEYTGLSPANYIQEMKIERAKHMLMTSELSIKEIAYILNYESVSYFSHTFRNRTGKAPTEYRHIGMK